MCITRHIQLLFVKMLGITHRICVALTIVVLFCSTFDCLQINLEESVSYKLENVDVYPEDSEVTDSTKIEEIYNEVVPDANEIFAGEKESHDEQVSDVLKTKVINTLKTERKVRQTRSNHGYESLYPHVPSGPPYNQYQPSAPQWNPNTYNYSQPGFPTQQGYKPNQGSFNPSQQPYNTNQNPYNPNQGTYNPSQVPYNPSQGTYNSSLPYNPNQGSYNPSHGTYNPHQGQYNQTNRPFNSNTGSNYPSNVPYNPNHGQYNYSNTRPYNPSAGLTPYGSYSSTSRTYYPARNQSSFYNRNTSVPPYSNSYKPQNSAVNYITTPRQYNSGYNNSYPGQQHYNNNYPTNPNNGSQRPPYNNNYNPSQNPSYPYPSGPSNPSSQYPQNSNPYGYNTNSYSQYPTQNYHPRNSTYPQQHYK